MEVSSELPAWLQRRVAYDNNSTTAQDIQSGAQLYQQSQENRQRAQQFAIQQEAKRLSLEGQKHVASGAIELGRLMEEGGRKNLYAEPEFEGRLWSIGQRYPQLLDSDTFKGAAKVLDNAKDAKLRAELTNITQTNITERTQANIEARLNNLLVQIEGRKDLEGVRGEINMIRDQLKGSIQSGLQTQKDDAASELEAQREEGRINRQRIGLENTLSVLDAKGEQAEHLREIQHDLDVKRDALKPRTKRPEQYDLDESDRMMMQEELRGLGQWRKINRGAKNDAEFDKRMQKIEDKYSSRRHKASSAPEKDPLGLFAP